MRGHAFFRMDGNLLLLLQESEPLCHRLLHIRRLHRLELEHRRAAEYRVVHVKIRVFGGGGNEGDPPVLNMFQQALLLLFVEILDLVQVQ